MLKQLPPWGRAGCAVTAAFCLVVASCGGGSGTKASSTTTSGSSATSRPSSRRSADQLTADRQTARAALLRLSDLPAGWDAKPRDDSTDNTPEAKAAEKTFTECIGVDASLLGTQDNASKATAKSDKFTDGQNTEIENSVSVEPTADVLNQAMTALQEPKARGCFQTYVNTAVKYAIEHPSPGSTVPQGVTFGNPQVATLNLPGVHADAAVAYRLSLPVSARGFSITLYLDFLFATRGRAVTTFSYQNLSDPVAADQETQLVNVVLNRLPASQTSPA